MEEDDDDEVRVGKKEVRSSLLSSVKVWHSGPPSTTSSLFSTGPFAVWTMVVLMVLVQLAVWVVVWVLLDSPSNKAPPWGPLSSVMDLEEEAEEEEARDEEYEVPGTLETVAGDELEPSSASINMIVLI